MQPLEIGEKLKEFAPHALVDSPSFPIYFRLPIWYFAADHGEEVRVLS